MSRSRGLHKRLRSGPHTVGRHTHSFSHVHVYLLVGDRCTGHINTALFQNRAGWRFPCTSSDWPQWRANMREDDYICFQPSPPCSHTCHSYTAHDLNRSHLCICHMWHGSFSHHTRRSLRGCPPSLLMDPHHSRCTHHRHTSLCCCRSCHLEMCIYVYSPMG